MNKSEIEGFFLKFNMNSTLQRVDAQHPLELYLGRSDEGYKTLFTFSTVQFPKLKSSKGILIHQYNKNDNYILAFKLVNESIQELFYIFCVDMIEATRHCTKTQGNSCIVNRYLKWQTLFEKQRVNLLSEEEVKGLLGELLFLRDFAIEKYGETNAINAWIGPCGCDQDFSIENCWYEIKSVNSGAKTVGISSLEQLDNDDEGYLIVVELDKTSSVNNRSITLNGLIDTILLELKEISNQEKFNEILFNYGYIKLDAYDDYCYKLSSMKQYKVSNNFPKLVAANIPKGVVAIKYEISTSELLDFYVGDIKCLRKN